ncbi:uncharacterized protein TRAVEDRAFT_47301 [Trametes versicolor FP-101664 SS1]|uniref:uncharacterized protein n=1 Tax=Trametes versicolor (strain FP-101664) TaxID=717944 RepID=UPI0004624567|nr:uncharacterized protein TRAVEDRAFT_47301 [Trametes versicolor FP-101664 SS1]EIW58124.1 hypothetical protein TRAVEDRAFT_47301 [Trametes versicolor FP-101664 SS1]
MFTNKPAARTQEKETQAEEIQTMPLDDEFLHLDFLKLAHTIATNGDRPRDAHTADLVTSLLAVSRLSARIACELTWDQISADNKGILIARRDMARIIRDYDLQMERTIAGGEAQHLHVHGPMPAPAPLNMSQLIDNGSSSVETVAHWTAEPMTKLLKDTLFERLKVPLFTLLKESLHEPLLKSLAGDLYSDLLAQLRAPLQQDLAEPLIAGVAPGVVAKAKAQLDELMRDYKTEVAHEADALEKRELILKTREIAFARECAAARDHTVDTDFDCDDARVRDRALERDVGNTFYSELALDIVRDRDANRALNRNRLPGNTEQVRGVGYARNMGYGREVDVGVNDQKIARDHDARERTKERTKRTRTN